MVDIVTGRVSVDQRVVPAVAVAVEHLGVVDIRDDGVWADESADDRVVEPCAIVVEPGLRVELLVSELVVGDFCPGMVSHLSIGDILRGLYLRPRGIGHRGGAAEVAAGYFIVKELKTSLRAEIQLFIISVDILLSSPQYHLCHVIELFKSVPPFLPRPSFSPLYLFFGFYLSIVFPQYL